MAMTLQQFMQATGAKPVYDEESGQVRGLDAPVKDANYWQNFAKLLGYEGQDVGKFLVGMVDANGNPQPAGSYRGTPVSGWENAPGVREFVGQFGIGGLTKDIQNSGQAAGQYALDGGGVNPAEYFAGQIDRGSSSIGGAFKDFITQPAALTALAGVGLSAAGLGGAGAGAIDYTSGAGLESLISGAGSAAPASGGGLWGSAGETGAFDIAGSAGTGLAGSTGLPAGAVGQAGFTVGAGQTAAQAAAGLGGLSSLTNGGSGNSTFGIPNNILGGAAQGLGGWLAANQTGNAYENVANQYLQLGAPSRDRFEASFQPGWNLMSADPSLQAGIDTAASSAARAMSVNGNPAQNPGMNAELQKYLLGSVILPQTNTYRSQQLTGGQLGTNIAGTASMGQAGTAGSGMEAIGAGLGTIFNPQPNISDWMKQLGMGGNNQYALNIGGMRMGG